MKITFSILLIAFSIIIAAEMTGTIFIYESKITLEQNIMNSAQEKDAMLINRIDNYISTRTVDMFNLVNDASVIQAVTSSNSEFQKMDNPIQYIGAQNVTWSVSKNTDNPLMSSIVENPTSDRLRHMLNVEKKIFHGDVFSRLLLANSYGADVAGNMAPDDYDQLTDPWYVAARQNGFYVGDVARDKSSGTVGIPLAVKINDDAGNFIGVAKGVINVGTLFATLSDQMKSAAIVPVEYELLDNKGTILYSTNQTEKSLVFSYPNEFMRQIRGQSGVFIYDAPDEEEHLVAYARSNSSTISPTSNWILATEYSPTQILKPAKDLTNLMILLMFVMASITSIVVFVVSTKSERTMLRIMTSMHSFMKGNAEHITPDGFDEIKDLTVMLNQLMKSLTESKKKIV